MFKKVLEFIKTVVVVFVIIFVAVFAMVFMFMYSTNDMREIFVHESVPTSILLIRAAIVGIVISVVIVLLLLSCVASDYIEERRKIGMDTRNKEANESGISESAYINDKKGKLPDE